MFCCECKKELKGGFSIEGTENFQCADCAIRAFELKSIASTIKLIESQADLLNNTEVNGLQYKALSESLKQGLREISCLCNYTLKNSKLLKGLEE